MFQGKGGYLPSHTPIIYNIYSLQRAGFKIKMYSNINSSSIILYLYPWHYAQQQSISWAFKSKYVNMVHDNTHTHARTNTPQCARTHMAHKFMFQRCDCKANIFFYIYPLLLLALFYLIFRASLLWMLLYLIIVYLLSHTFALLKDYLLHN